MVKFTEGRTPGEVILSEANFHRSRDTVTIRAGAGIIQPGHVLGRITSTGKHIPSPNAVVVGSEGAETATAVAIYGADATSADVDIAVLSRHAEIQAYALIYDSSVNDAAKRATKLTQLRAQGIISR